ncbi:MAG: hypothetical protein AAFY26_16080 [Cyanobacteria bacterium J06638_22]
MLRDKANSVMLNLALAWANAPPMPLFLFLGRERLENQDSQIYRQENSDPSGRPVLMFVLKAEQTRPCPHPTKG